MTTRRSCRRGLLLTTGIALVAVTAACSGSSHASAPTATASRSHVVPVPVPSIDTTPAPPPNAPAVPASGAYLGAFVNPQKAGEPASLPAFVTGTGDSPKIIGLYTPWAAPAPVASMQQVASSGAIPLVAWGCTSTAQVASGADDATITAYASALKSYGKPVLLRWFWEMNLMSPTHTVCLGSGGPAGFVAAWQHMRQVFDREGASNVAFVWSPGISGGLAKMPSYFPGAASVDWIAIDGYARRGASDFAGVFGAWYQAWSGAGRPLMVAETGAGGAQQPAYFASIARELPQQFPAIKAVVYFDAGGAKGDWALSPGGMTAFGSLARSPYFSARD